MALFAAFCIPESQGCLSTRAAILLADGSARTYHEGLAARYALCLESETGDVVCEPLTDWPEPLFVMYDIGPDPDNPINRLVADYFGLHSIRTLDTGE